MLVKRGGCVTISLTSTSHTVHLLLAQLGHTLSLITVGEGGDTVETTISCRCAAGTALSASKGLVWVVVDVHGIGVRSRLTDRRTAARLVGGTGTRPSCGIVVASGVQPPGHLGQLLGLCAAGDGGAVLQRLAHLGFVAHQHALLADEIGLQAVVGVFDVFHALVGLVIAIGLELLLFLLEGGELALDIRIHKVVDVLALPHLGNLIVVPLIVAKSVVALHVEVVDTGTAVLLFDIAFQSPAVGVVLVVLLEVLDGLGNEGLTQTTHGLSHVDTGQNVAETAAGGGSGGAGLELLGDSLSKELVAGSVLDGGDTFGGGAGNLQHLDILCLEDLLQLLLVLRLQVLGTTHINLVNDNKHNFVGKQGLDAVEKLDLIADGISTLLGKIHEVEDSGPQVSNSGDRLHFNGVHLLQRVVQNSGGINGLETEVFVIEMANEQTLSSESVGLNINVCAGNIAQEA